MIQYMSPKLYIYCNKETICYFIDYVKSIYYSIFMNQAYKIKDSHTMYFNYANANEPMDPICLHSNTLDQKIVPGDILILMQTDIGIDRSEGIDLNKYKDMKIFISNTEQMTNEESLEKLLALSKKYSDIKLKFLDYSEDNVTILKSHNIDSYFIPYQFTNIENIKLTTNLLGNKQFDIATIGFETPRRCYIYDELERFGIRVNRLCKLGALWDEERDIILGRCKIMLNVHAYSDYTIYESMRCCRWLLTGEMMVVSEDCLNQDTLDIKDLIVFDTYKNLIKKTVDVIINYDRYFAEYQQKHKDSIDAIVNNRANYLLCIK